jgi:hypothetical protein
VTTSANRDPQAFAALQPLNMAEVVRGLEVVEGRSRAEIIADLTALECD